MAIRLYNDDGSSASKLIRLYDPSDVQEPTQPQVQEPGFLMQNFPGTLEKLADLQVDPFSFKEDSKKVISDYFKGIGESIVGAGESLRDAFEEAKGGTTSGTMGKSLEFGARTLGAVLSPITSAFTAVENIPGWGSAAKLINTAFSAIGEGTTAVSDTVIDKLPIDEKTKENLKPGIAEALSLATQILAGGAVEGAFRVGKPKVEELTQKYGKQDAQTIVTKAVEIAKEQKSPTVEGKQGQLRLYEPPKTLETAPETTTTQRPSKAASDINKQIVEQGFKELPETELSKYSPITKADQLQKAAELLTNDLTGAKDMAMGRKPSGDINTQVVFNAVKNKAIREGDISTLRDLARSPVAEARSLVAQELGASGFDNIPNDPVRAMQEVSKARMEKVKDPVKVKSKVKEEIKKEIKKPSKEDWSSFVEGLVC